MRCICCLIALLMLTTLVMAETKVELGERFSDNMIIALNLPKDVEAQPTAPSSGAVGIWIQPKKNWVITVAQTMLDEPRPLEDREGANKVIVPGLLAQTVAQLRGEGSDVLRSEVMPGHANIPGHESERLNQGDIGLIVARVSVSFKDQVLQEALVRSNDRVYATVKMYCPPPVGDPEKDPALAEAMATFTAMIDSIEVIDGAKVRKEQEDRLLRTRQMMMQWTRQKIQAAMVASQYLRIRREGKDIGYCFVLNEVASGLPQAVRDATTHEPLRDPRTGDLQRLDARIDPAKAEGVRVGIRTRMFPEAGKFLDVETWLYVSYDRDHEIWKRLQVASDPQNPSKRARSIWSSEIGSADRSMEKQFNRPTDPRDMKKMEADLATFDEAMRKGEKPPENLRLPFRMVEQFRLTVRTENENAVAAPVTRELPPFYLPGPLLEMLPRLVDPGQATGYLFAVYDSQRRQITMLYVDVKNPTDMTFEGKRQTLVPVVLRHGMNGPAITHYVTLDGHYVGTVNEEEKITLVPTDEAALREIWKGTVFDQPTEK